MARHGHIWERKGRPGFYAEINGRQCKLGNDRKEAERAYHRLKLEARPRAARDYSIPDLVEEYLTWVVSRVKPKTYKNYYEALQEWSRDNSRLHPSELKAYHLTKWLDGKTKWNQSTRKTQGSAVKIWSAWLENQDYIERDRLRTAKLDEALKRKVVAMDDLARFTAAIDEPYFQAYWLVLWDTGARPEEIATLTAATIRPKTSSAIVDGKTGERLIGLSDRALDLLRTAAEENPAGPVLRTARGRLWSANVRRNHTEKIKARCDPPVDPELTLYQARHTLWQRWHEAGIDDVVIAKQLGHTSHGTTSLRLLKSTYAHAEAAPLARAANRASAQSTNAERTG